MGKKSSPPSKKEKRKKLVFYLLGTIFLLGIIRVKMNRHATVDVSDAVADYLFHKQEIVRLIGEVEDHEYVTKPAIEVSKKSYELVLSVKGSKTNGQLYLRLNAHTKGWDFSSVTLKVNGEIHSLSPTYVSKSELFAASLNSAPVKQPVFLEGESLHMRLWLKGLSVLNRGDRVIESLDIFDPQGALVASKKDVAHFELGQKKIPSRGISFTNTINDLAPGKYTLSFRFENQASALLENFRQDIFVRAVRDELAVEGVSYYLDAARTQKAGATFKPGQVIYLSMNLDGFKVEGSKIAGLVDLKVMDSLGKIVASKPRFAAFTENYDSRKVLTINGDIALKDPGVYFLSFRIQDHFSDREITRDEKVIVKLAGK